MDNSELISELLEALTNDVKTLKAQVEKLPTQAPTDYKTSIEGLTKAVQELQTGSKQAPPSVDLSAITARLDRIEQMSRQRPEYKMSQYVQYGAYAFGLMVILLATSVWYAHTWRSEREQYAQAYTQDNWRVRYTKQVNPEYYSYMEGVYTKDPNSFKKWTAEQEQADQKRELAREAAAQAKALSDQANRLEGKPTAKGKKKG
jgi:type IV secretory pathway VirB10-like protein